MYGLFGVEAVLLRFARFKNSFYIDIFVFFGMQSVLLCMNSLHLHERPVFLALFLWPLVLKIFFAKFACFPIWSATWDELRF
jgi:hypothetical protein